MDLNTAAQAIGGEMRGTNLLFLRVATDSRDIKQGDLFIALRGERFDGHDFVAQAQQQGAVAAVVNETYADRLSGNLLCVADPLLALGHLAAYWRAQFNLPLVAVAGSNGKTTVKEMIAAIFLAALKQPEAVLATEGNLNNQIGVPLTLLRLRETHRYAVVEIGINHSGETAYLAQLVQPTIALINNAQREHQEFLRSVAEVATEHAAVLEALPDQGIAVFNADDSFAPFWRRVVTGVTTKQKLEFGLEAHADVTGKYRLEQQGCALELYTPQGEAECYLQIPGLHNVYNALAATAAATAAGVSLAAISEGLSQFRPCKARLECKAGPNGSTIIDDTYNANPDSVRAAIDVLANQVGNKVLVLGDMGEVGEQGTQFHQEIGRYAKEQGINRLLAIGELSAASVVIFGEGAEHFAELADLLNELRGELKPQVSVLVKGSRFMRMERVVMDLLDHTVHAKD